MQIQITQFESNNDIFDFFLFLFVAGTKKHCFLWIFDVVIYDYVVFNKPNNVLAIIITSISNYKCSMKTFRYNDNRITVNVYGKFCVQNNYVKKLKTFGSSFPVVFFISKIQRKSETFFNGFPLLIEIDLLLLCCTICLFFFFFWVSERKKYEKRKSKIIQWIGWRMDQYEKLHSLNSESI